MACRGPAAAALAAAVGTLLAVSCGGSAVTPTPSAVAPSASPTPQPVLAAVDRGLSGGDRVRLLTLDGQELARTSIPAGAPVPGVAGDKVVWLEGTVLKGMDKDGKVSRLGTLPATPSSPVVLSPDGTSWAWTRSDAQGGQTHSVVYVGSKPLLDATEAGHQLQPVTWTARGVVVQDATLGLGGYIPIGGVTGKSELLNPQTGTTRPLTDERCLFLDLATDGTLACRTPANGLFGADTIRLIHPDGTRSDIPTPSGDRFRFAGAASFKPDLQTTELAVGGAAGSAATTSPPGVGERFETDLIDVGTASMRQLGNVGLEPGAGPWAWISGGWLITWRPAQAAGGEPGIYLVGLTGVTRQITPLGQPVGILSSSSASGSSVT